MTETSFFPRSLIWFAITLGAVAIQVIPLVNLLSLLVLMPWWPVVTLNLGFASFAVEAALGKIHPAWLLLPLFWFGGYGMLALQSHRAVQHFDAEFRARNDAQQLTFDPAKQNLVFSNNESVLSGAAERFVQHYDLDVTYQANPNFKAADHLAHRIAGRDLCDQIRNDNSYQSAGIYTHGFHEGHIFIKSLCSVRIPEDPQRAPVTIKTTTQSVENFLLPYRLHTITISGASPQPVTLQTAHAQPLPWLPMFMFGCNMMSSKPGTQCGAQIIRSDTGLGGTGAYGGAASDALARALKLRRSPASERQAALAAAPPPNFGTAIGKTVEASLATLKSAIANPRQPLNVHDVAGLGERPDIVAEHATAITTAIMQAIGRGEQTYEPARVMQNLLVALPDVEFEKHARILLAFFKARGGTSEREMASSFAARLGDFGADALPILESLAFENPRRANAGAIAGLCRMGPAASSLSGQLSKVLATTARRNDEHSNAFVALLRMGAKDLALADPESAAPYRNKDYAHWLQTITPNSPPSSCDVNRLWPRLPDSLRK